VSTAPAAVHAWMPRSPCDAGCLPQDPPLVSGLVRALRWSALVIVGLIWLGASLVAIALPVMRPHVHRSAARWVLRCCGVRLRVQGGRSWAPRGEAVLVVGEHVSWLDALALPAVQPVRLVSRADVEHWPLVGVAARRGRTVFVERERLRALPAVVADVAAALRSGGSVAVFAEGTTWCGTAHGSFRPAMFQAAIDAGVPVLPVSLRYLLVDGSSTTAPAFVGAETFVQGLRRLLRLRGVVLEVTLLPAEHPGVDRRELATRCTAAVAALRRVELPPMRVCAPGHERSTSASGVHSDERTITRAPHGSRTRPSQPSRVAG